MPCVILCALFGGCSGGGGSSVPQAAGGGGSSSGAAAGTQSVVVAIKIPGSTAASSSSVRHPLYVSPNTNSVAIAVNGGTSTVASLASGSANCTAGTGGARSCSVTVSAPVGADTFTETTYQSTNGTGAVLSQNTTSAKIVAGQANTVNLTLDGVVASISLSLNPASPPTGTPATIALTVNFFDASGYGIIGSAPFANPITLTDSDTSKVTSLSKSTLGVPSDATGITVAYTGGSLATPATFSASASGVPASAISPATLTPSSPSSSASFVDWPTYAYDAQRSGFNPSSTAFNPGSISSIKLGWQTPINGSTQSQPIVATGIGGHQALLVVADFALAQAYDGLTGSRVWQTTLPTQDVQTCGVGGISGTAVYDKSLGAIFMVAGKKGSGSPNHVILYELNVATGAIMNSVDVTPSLEPGEANYSHAGVSMANGMIYVGTGSDCEGSATATYPSWRGRVAAVNPASMTLEKTFFTSWQVGSSPGNYGGGGVWSWGGVSADASGNIYVSTGNGETNSALGSQQIQPPFTATTNEQAGLSENVIELSGDLSTVKGSNYPGFNFTIGRGDLDFAGTPVIFQPPGCGVLSATQGKAGLLVVNNTQNAMSLVQTFGLSVPSSSAYYMGNPAYSPVTGYLYAPISSSGAGSSMLAPGLAAISGCGTSIVWHAQFGPDSSNYSGDNPRSGPTVTAGGVVFIGTPCTPDGSGGCGGVSGTASGAVWAIDASSGTVLNNQKPILITGANIRMAPSVDGLWVYVLDGAGNFYGLTIDPTVQAKTVKPGNHTTTSTYKYHDNE
jgi:hypothetical protein